MQLVVKSGAVVAVHEDGLDLRGKYPGCEVVTGTLPVLFDPRVATADPRTAAEKLVAYKDQRRLEYPSVEDQLDMLYHDAIDGTTTWRDAITAVKAKYPKPKEVAERGQ